MPDFETEQEPKAIAVVLLTVHVFLYKSLQIICAKDSGVYKSRIFQAANDEFLEVRSHPAPDGKTEALFRQIDQFGRDVSCGDLAQQVLQLPATDFHVCRQSGCKFDHARIDEWRAYFE